MAPRVTINCYGCRRGVQVPRSLARTIRDTRVTTWRCDRCSVPPNVEMSFRRQRKMLVVTGHLFGHR